MPAVCGVIWWCVVWVGAKWFRLICAPRNDSFCSSACVWYTCFACRFAHGEYGTHGIRAVLKNNPRRISDCEIVHRHRRRGILGNYRFGSSSFLSYRVPRSTRAQERLSDHLGCGGVPTPGGMLLCTPRFLKCIRCCRASP
jgi:hypothetical protein